MENKKIIINALQHNCSHCGTKSAYYRIEHFIKIDLFHKKYIYAIFLRCQLCKRVSMHLVKDLPADRHYELDAYISVNENLDMIKERRVLLSAQEIDQLDDNIILSVPTPTAIIDSKIPSRLRDLLIEALKCINENALTGASACIRKAIYEFLKKEDKSSDSYDDKIKKLKRSYPVLEKYLDVLIGIKGITSDQMHEDSFTSFNSEEARAYVAVLEEIFKEVYVLPQQRAERKKAILDKYCQVNNAKKKVDKNSTRNQFE